MSVGKWCLRLSVLIGATNRSLVGLAGQAGYLPVWDSMCRIMHDNDSATGLLCRNAVGEQWIAMGDKQLFMPMNGEFAVNFKDNSDVQQE